MQVHVSDPSLVDDLVEELARWRCKVEPVDVDIVSVDLPILMTPRRPEVELDLYLGVWEATHPGSRARRIVPEEFSSGHAHKD